MKKLFTLITLLALTVCARAQFTVMVDSNGFLRVQALGNGKSSNFFQTNMSWLMAAITNDPVAKQWFLNVSTNSQNIPRKIATNWLGISWVFDTATITNLNAPGAGTDSIRIGTSSDAPGLRTIAIGRNANATADYAINFGYTSLSSGYGAIGIGSSVFSSADGAVVIGNGSEVNLEATNSMAIGTDAVVDGHTNSIAIGNQSATTAHNQIRAGTAAQSVSIPGKLESAKSELATVVGTNIVAGRFSYLAGANATLINGNNGGILLGTNQFVDLSGGTTIAQIAGFAASTDGDVREISFSGAITNWIVNEANSVFSTDAVAANRIKTGTAGDITLTNQPAWIRVRYRGASARWEILQHSR